MKIAKKPKQKRITIDESKAITRKSINTGLLIMMVATKDVLKRYNIDITYDQMCDIMNYAMHYSKYIEDHTVELELFSESLYKDTGIDIRIKKGEFTK